MPRNFTIFLVFSFLGCYGAIDIERLPFFLACYLYALLSMGSQQVWLVLHADKQNRGGHCILSDLVLWFPFLAFDAILFHMHIICLHLITVWQWLLLRTISDAYTLWFYSIWMLPFWIQEKYLKTMQLCLFFFWILHCQITSMCLTYMFTDCWTTSKHRW